MTDEGRGGEYQRRVLALDHSGVLELWQGLRAGVSPPEWPAGVLLEYLLLRAFQLEGAEVTWPYRVYRDGVLLEQIDGVVYFDGVSCLVECKDMTRPVDTSTIVKLKSQLLRRPRTTIGALFCTGEVSEAASSVMNMLPPPDVLLWEGEELEQALREQRLLAGMRRKLRHAVEMGFAEVKPLDRGNA
ncbi:MAG TPA: restriction endonuclease [Archangium sp.]|uniref:restriction endonuclease n=1 Tax=Archangium sp. TaxID=1872627 RepID=UPI002E359D5C|nr:restriction endonuclease [Archangium sp.]HEX5751980.1 restriction endonuclease [Archangium sp.]